jgi:hypothetical protein
MALAERRGEAPPWSPRMKITINLLTVVGMPAARPATLASAMALPPSLLELASPDAESLRDDEEVHVISTTPGSVAQLDGWRVRLDPDRVELLDIHSDLRIVFRRLGAQWVLDPGE